MIAGVNYPWRTYGGDFGPTVWGTHDGVRTHVAEIAADLGAIAAAGARVVRWFVFTDARGGVIVDDRGWPAAIHPEAFADLDALLGLALAAGVQLVPVLFDHRLAFDASDVAGARLGGHASWLADPDGQARLVEQVVAPLAARYGRRGPRAELGRAIYAWDLFNEPDWIVQELHPHGDVSAPVPFDVFAAWLRRAADELRRAGAWRVTLGNARLRFVRHWSDPSFAFDFLQVHAYYDPAWDFDLRDTSPHDLGVACPVVVGECPAGGEAADDARRRPAVTLADLAGIARDRGFAAVWPWSWRGGDVHGPLTASALACIHGPGSDP